MQLTCSRDDAAKGSVYDCSPALPSASFHHASDSLRSAERGLLALVRGASADFRNVKILFSVQLCACGTVGPDVYNIHMSHGLRQLTEYPRAGGYRVLEIIDFSPVTYWLFKDTLLSSSVTCGGSVVNMRVKNSEALEPLYSTGRTLRYINGTVISVSSFIPVSSMTNLRVAALAGVLTDVLCSHTTAQFAEEAYRYYVQIDYPCKSLSYGSKFQNRLEEDVVSISRTRLAVMDSSLTESFVTGYETRYARPEVNLHLLSPGHEEVLFESPRDIQVGQHVVLRFDRDHPLDNLIAVVTAPAITMDRKRNFPLDKVRVPVRYENRIDQQPTTVKLINLRHLRANFAGLREV